MMELIGTRRGFSLGLLGVLPFGGILLTTGCNALSEFTKYFDLGVTALDAALPTILGTSSTAITGWANLIASAYNAASAVLEGSANDLSKASQIASIFDQVVLPNISGLSASVTTEIGKILSGVDQFLASLGLTQSGTAQPLNGRAIAPHVVTTAVKLSLNSVDKNVLTIDQQKLQSIIKATK